MLYLCCISSMFDFPTLLACKTQLQWGYHMVLVMCSDYSAQSQHCTLDSGRMSFTSSPAPKQEVRVRLTSCCVINHPASFGWIQRKFSPAESVDMEERFAAVVRKNLCSFTVLTCCAATVSCFQLTREETGMFYYNSSATCDGISFAV